MKAIQWDGKTITKPGMYRGISLDEYHDAAICDGPSLSSSNLRTIFNESPAHFYSEWRGNPDRVERPTPRHFILGRAAHHLFLGEPNFRETFAVEPPEYEADDGEIKPWNNNAKACRLWHAERAKERRLVLKPDEVDKIRGMAGVLGEHSLLVTAMRGQIERSLFWKDKKTGVWLKARPDTIPTDGGDVVDYKTTTSVQWPDLVKAIGDFSYHQQGALICRAFREVLEINAPTFSLVFQEKEPPFCVAFVILKESDLARGDKQNRYAIDTFARCLKAKKWPGPVDGNDPMYVELSEKRQQDIDAKLSAVEA